MWDSVRAHDMRRIQRVAATLVAVSFLTAVVVPSASVAAEPCDADPFSDELVAEIAARWPANRFTAEVLDLETGCRYSLNRELRPTTASVIKISIMAAALLRAQDQGRAITEWEHERIVPMISESDNPTASALWVSLGGSPGMRSYLERFGLEETVPISPKWGASTTSASDQVDLMVQLVIGGGPLGSDGRARARQYLLGVVPDQQWGAPAGLPEAWDVPMKNGFYPLGSGGWRINTVGLVEDPLGAGWVVTILSDRWPRESTGIEAVEFIANAINQAMLAGRAPAFGRIQAI